MIEMQQVHGHALEPGTWVKATYEDTEKRIVYMCGCGKVNALPLEARDPELGTMIDEDGELAKIACERKTCDSNDERTFVASTADEMDAHAADKAHREAAERALDAGVTSDDLGRAEVRRAEAAAASS